MKGKALKTVTLSPEVKSVALKLFEGLSCPRALTVAILLRHGEWDQLAGLAIRPSDYCNSEQYWAANAATEFLRKCRDLPTSFDLEAKARESFYAAEAQCFKTNERLSPLLFNSVPDGCDEALLDFVDVVRKKMIELIGHGPEGHEHMRFGPGATMSDKSVETTVPDKLSSCPTITPNAWPLLSSWRMTAWYRSRKRSGIGEELEIVRGNSFFTVPKSATSLRGCAKEPSLNGSYQLAVGASLKRRILKLTGVKLKDAQSVHQQVAAKSSKDDLTVTIDLSSASDTVCYNLVKLVTPYRWFKVFDTLRSPTTEVEGRVVHLEKFSSMGNGFTFELETVIFASLLLALSEDLVYGKNLHVFGDDIIIPKEHSASAVAVLKYFGFTLNLKKSFLEGPFKESCGGDYYDGVGVRAYYLEECPCEPQQYIAMANGIRRLAREEPKPGCRWDLVRNAWLRCLDFLPSDIRRCRGPKDLGDLVVEDDEKHWQYRWRANGIRYVRVYRPCSYRVARWEGFGYSVQWAAALYLAGTSSDPMGSAPVRNFDGSLTLRNGVSGYKLGWLAFS